MKADKFYVIGFFKGIAAAVLTAFALVLLCALITKLAGGASELVLGIINGVIRITAVGAGCFFYCKKRGLLRGAVMGICVFFALYALFGILSASWELTAGRLFNLAICIAAGCIWGVIFSSTSNT